MSAQLTAKEERWLLNELGELIALMGPKQFLNAPLIEPNDRFFPDRWEPTARGVARLAKRLMRYAGLKDLGVSVREFHRASQAVDWGSVRPEHTGQGRETIAWFAGFDDDGVARFGVALDIIKDPELLVGAMSHEVAHAYREYHRLVEGDHDLEEKLTDLTTVFLGFGILTANSAYRYRAGTEYRGAQSYSQWSFSQAGYLSLDAMSFLLAAQVRARELGFWERRRIRRLLEANQAGAFSRAYRSFVAPAELREYLGLPRKRPAKVDRKARTASRPQLKVLNLARHSHRVVDDRRWWGLALGATLVAAAALQLQRPWLECVGEIAGGAVLGLVIGLLVRKGRCALPDCRKPLGRDDISCPHCGALIGAPDAELDTAA